MNNLPKLPDDPKPSTLEIDKVLQSNALLRGLSGKTGQQIAKILWKVDLKERNLDLFRAPFTGHVDAFPDGSESYQSYLSGELWHKIRVRTLARSGGKCECCGKTATQVHHRDYRPRVLRGDDLLPLVSICKQCHELIHRDPSTGKQRDSWQDEEAALTEIYRYGLAVP
jgi:hypothetical protein